MHKYKEIADSYDAALSKAREKMDDPDLIKQVIANGDDIGRFPGVMKHGVKISKRQHSTDEGGLNSVITHHKNAWTKPPETEAEEVIYYGFHVHNETNPYGLHTHFIGGTLGGAHSHGPVNLTGKHTHKDVDMTTENINKPISISGDHKHECPISPDGKHVHEIQDYGND